MRTALLSLSLLLVACGGEADPPVLVETTDVTVTPEASDPDTLLVAAGETDDMPDAEVSGAGVASAGEVGTSEIDPSDAGPSDIYVGGWAGDLPVLEDGTHFVAVPPVRAKLEEAFGVEPGLLDKLSNLDEEPYYLISPIESVGSMLGLTFTANSSVNEDERTLYLLVADDASHVFALLTETGSTFYRASYDASAEHLPAEAAAWMSQKGGVDFAEMVRLDDETELGP